MFGIHAGLLQPLRVAVVAEAAAMYPDLVAWWAYEDNAANATILDSHSTHHATRKSGNSDVNTQTSNGKVGRWQNQGGTGASIIVPRSDTAFDKGDVSFAFGGWYYWQTNNLYPGGNFMQMFGRSNLGVGGGFSYLIGHSRDSGDMRWRFYCSGDGSSLTGVAAAAAAISSATWFFLIGVHDSVNNEMRFYVNNVKTTAAHSAGIYSGGNANFTMGQAITGDSTFCDTNRMSTAEGRDESFFFNRALSDAEASYLYNNGAGRSYAEFRAASGN